MADSTNIIKKTLLGISKAQKDYKKWSNYWLWTAPEYMITTYIAKEISTLGVYYLTLEQNADETIDEAGGPGSGRMTPEMRKKLNKGRFDIVVWDGDTPIIIIEVKKQPRGFYNIESDVDNICRVLKGKKNYLQYGLIAYYAAWKETSDESAEGRTLGKVEAIKCEAYDHVNKRWGLKPQQYLSHPESNAWIGVVLKISKKN